MLCAHGWAGQTQLPFSWWSISQSEIRNLAAKKLAKDVAGRIQEELKYPGEIKVNVIRETRVTEYAK